VWNELSNRHKPQLLLLTALHGSCSGKLHCICCLLIQRHYATPRGPSGIQKLYPLLNGTVRGLLLDNGLFGYCCCSPAREQQHPGVPVAACFYVGGEPLARIWKNETIIWVSKALFDAC
jgi:hypothetical protein